MVGRYIASDPQEAQRFHDYNVIDSHKFSNRAAAVYASDWQPKQDVERETFYKEMKKEFKYDPCENCGRPTQDSFTKHSLPALARRISVSEPIRLRDGTLKNITIEDAYLICAAMPNAHIHASMWSFFQRLNEAGDGIVWNQNQECQAEFALSCAHMNMPMVLESQNDFFNLGLEEEIKERQRDWHKIWKPGHSKPSLHTRPRIAE